MPFVLASTLEQFLQNLVVACREQLHQTAMRVDSMIGVCATHDPQYDQAPFVSPLKSAVVKLYSMHEAVK